jgi:tetratricopeptide (TPR) repeat protein
VRFYEQALELWPEDDAERATLLFRRARAVSLGIDYARLDLLEQARDAFLALGDRETAAEAETFAALALRMGGRQLDAVDRARSAVALLEDAPASRAKAHVLANLARLVMVTTERQQEAIETGEEALAMAEDLGLEELRAHALNTIGSARLKMDDHAGIDPLEESLRLALEHGSPFEIGRVQNNLAVGYLAVGRVEEAVATIAARLEMAERFGLLTGWDRSMLARFLWTCGRWEEAEGHFDDLLEANEAPILQEPDLRALAAEFRLARDDIAGAASECERGLELLRGLQEDVEAQETLRVLLVMQANIALAEGRRTVADELADAALAAIPTHVFGGAVELALLLRDLGRGGDALVELAMSRPADPWWQVTAAIARGQLEQAADRLAEMGAASAEAEVRLRAARELVSQGRRAEADVQLQKALAFYRSVGATRYIREAEALLAATA